MRRDLDRLANHSFDLLIIGAGIHGLAAAYDAAQRGLSVALVERGDFGGASSFNHLKTVHGGLRYLQSGDLRRMRESIVERRTIARLAPHLLTPLPFLMPTYRKFTRSQLAMRVAFAVDATIGHDRNDGVVPRLHLPPGHMLSRSACLEVFPDVRQRGLTGGALWHDYQVRNTERLNVSFALAADREGACLANYAQATGAVRDGSRVAGARVRDVLSGDEFEVRASVTLNTAGAGAGRVMQAFGVEAGYPLLKAMNLVTSRPMSGPALASTTDSGRMLFIVPWQGRAVAGTSHSLEPCGPDEMEVSPAELQAFLVEINEAFPALDLQVSDVTLVHRGVVPAMRHRNGELDLEGHFKVRDHAADGAEGALSLVAVKYTTGRGVAAKAVDAVMARLGRRVASRTADVPLPGAAEDLDELRAGLQRAAPAALDERAVAAVAMTYGTLGGEVLALAREEPGLAAPVAPGTSHIAAEVAHAVRREMAHHLTDVVVRRLPLGSAEFPGEDVARGCAAIMARELGWDAGRQAEELDALRRFYAPVAPAPPQVTGP